MDVAVGNVSPDGPLGVGREEVWRQFVTFDPGIPPLQVRERARHGAEV